MDLAEGFRFHGDRIITRWVQYTLDTYGSAKFFAAERDQFANPVGGTVRESLKQLFGLLTAGAEAAEFDAPLNRMMAIRSVQEFTPSQAVAPLHAVKHLTRDAFLGDKERAGLVGELYDFEFAVDVAVLRAFDLYMQYRERLYKVRLAELRSGNHLMTDTTCPSKLLDEQALQVLHKDNGI